jgi:hypothetical protein
MSIMKSLAFALLCLSLRPASAIGIRVRFLASPAEDSVVRYDVWRCDSSGAPAKVGSLPAAAAADTLSFPDSTARRGVAYTYCLRAVNAAGVESDPSDSARVALPRLAFPDSALPAAGETRIALSPAAHPLRGHASLAFTLADSSRLRIVHDTAAGAVVFLSPLGLADTVTAIVRASYHGKFSDLDTLRVIVAARGLSAVAGPRAAAAFPTPSWTRPSGSGAVLLAVPAAGRVRLHRPDGRLAP